MGDRCAQALGFDFYRFLNRDYHAHSPIWLRVNPLTYASLSCANALCSNWSQTWDFQRGEHRERVGKSQHRTKPALPPGKLHFMMVYDHNIKNFVELTTNFGFFLNFSKNPRFGSEISREILTTNRGFSGKYGNSRYQIEDFSKKFEKIENSS